MYRRGVSARRSGDLPVLADGRRPGVDQKGDARGRWRGRRDGERQTWSVTMFKDRQSTRRCERAERCRREETSGDAGQGPTGSRGRTREKELPVVSEWSIEPDCSSKLTHRSRLGEREGERAKGRRTRRGGQRVRQEKLFIASATADRSCERTKQTRRTRRFAATRRCAAQEKGEREGLRRDDTFLLFQLSPCSLRNMLRTRLSALDNRAETALIYSALESCTRTSVVTPGIQVCNRPRLWKSMRACFAQDITSVRTCTYSP